MVLPTTFQVELDQAVSLLNVLPNSTEAALALANCYVKVGSFYIEQDDAVSASDYFTKAHELLTDLRGLQQIDSAIRRGILTPLATIYHFNYSRRDLPKALLCIRQMSDLAHEMTKGSSSETLKWADYFLRMQYARWRLELYAGDYAAARSVVAVSLQTLIGLKDHSDNQFRRLEHLFKFAAHVNRWPWIILIALSSSGRLQLKLAHWMILRKDRSSRLIPGPSD